MSDGDSDDGEHKRRAAAPPSSAPPSHSTLESDALSESDAELKRMWLVLTTLTELYSIALAAMCAALLALCHLAFVCVYAYALRAADAAAGDDVLRSDDALRAAELGRRATYAELAAQLPAALVGVSAARLAIGAGCRAPSILTAERGAQPLRHRAVAVVALAALALWHTAAVHVVCASAATPDAASPPPPMPAPPPSWPPLWPPPGAPPGTAVAPPPLTALSPPPRAALPPPLAAAAAADICEARRPYTVQLALQSILTTALLFAALAASRSARKFLTLAAPGSWIGGLGANLSGRPPPAALVVKLAPIEWRRYDALDRLVLVLIGWLGGTAALLALLSAGGVVGSWEEVEARWLLGAAEGCVALVSGWLLYSACAAQRRARPPADYTVLQ